MPLNGSALLFRLSGKLSTVSDVATVNDFIHGNNVSQPASTGVQSPTLQCQWVMKQLQKNISRLYAFSFLQMTLFPMAIITLFWKDHIGLSLTRILVLQGILSVVMVVMEYPTGYISDRIGYRAALNLASLLGITGWSIYTFATGFLQVALAETLLGISLAFISGTDSALLYETLKSDGKEHLYTHYQGRMGGIAQVGEAIGAVFAGVLYACSPILPFALQAGVWCLALLLTRTLVEPARHSPKPASHVADALNSIRFTFVENRRLQSTILLNSVLGLASFYPVWLIQPYMKQAGMPLTWFGPVWAGANICVAIASLASHRLNMAINGRGMVLIFMLLVWAGYLGLGISVGVWGFMYYYTLTIMRGLRGPMMLGYMHRESPSSHRAGILSLQSLFFRLLFTISGPLVGLLADTIGIQRTFLMLFFVFLTVLPILALLFLKRNSTVINSQEWQ